MVGARTEPATKMTEMNKMQLLEAALNSHLMHSQSSTQGEFVSAGVSTLSKFFQKIAEEHSNQTFEWRKSGAPFSI